MAQHRSLLDPPVDPNQMLRCFINPDRACGPDCMAYQTRPPPGQDYMNQQWPHCMVLVNAHRVGKHMVIIAEGLTKLLKGDPAKQAANIPPPEVR